jgi:hypothetical protein
MTNETLTTASRETFRIYAEDAMDWGGNPWVSVGNVHCTREMRGNLSDLVKKELIEICDNEGRGRAADMFISFTETGRSLAQSMNINLGG